MLTPNERLRVDAAGEGLYYTLHRDSLDDVMRDLRERRAGAVLVSVARCGGGEAERLATVVREFPRVPAIALLAAPDERAAQRALSLGRSGVRTLVDVREPGGWRELRAALAPSAAANDAARAAARLADDLAGVPADCLRFFDLLFAAPPRTGTVRELARLLGAGPSTLMSRFFRAGLPAPKQYLAHARLVRAARLFEDPGISVAGVANALDYSSPQSFGRHVRTLLSVTAVQFRRAYDGDGMLERFRNDLVVPYREILRTFSPLHPGPAWTRRK